jgi:hypothetical protein
MCIYIYNYIYIHLINYIQIYSMSNRPCQHQKSLQLDVHPLNDGIAQVLAWLIPIPTWTPVSAEAPSIGRAPEGTALLERCLGCLAVGMTTGVPAAPRLIKLGLPAHGSVVARDQSFPAQGEPGDHMVGLLCYQGQYRNAQAECGQGDKEEAQPLK